MPDNIQKVLDFLRLPPSKGGVSFGLHPPGQFSQMRDELGLPAFQKPAKSQPIGSEHYSLLLSALTLEELDFYWLENWDKYRPSNYRSSFFFIFYGSMQITVGKFRQVS